MVFVGNTQVPTIDSIGGKTGDITLGTGLSIDSNNVLSSSGNHTHSNKDVLDNITNADAQNWDSAYQAMHTHSNKSTLDDLSIATASEVSSLYASDSKKFIIFSNIETLVTNLVAHVNTWGAELRTLISAKVSNVKIDNTSVVSSNVATINTINANYNASTNKLATGSEIDTLQDEIDNLTARGRYLSQWNCASGQPATQPSSLPYTYKSGDYYIVGTVASGNYTHHITLQGTSSQGLYEGTNTYNVTFDLVNQTATAYTTLASIVADMEDDVKYTATGTVVNTTEGTINIAKVIKWSNGIGFVQADEQRACITDSEPTSITDTISGGSSTNYKPDGTTYTGAASTATETASVVVEDTYYYDGSTWHLQQNTQKTVSFANLAGQPSDNTALNTALESKADKAASYSAGNLVMFDNHGDLYDSGKTSNSFEQAGTCLPLSAGSNNPLTGGLYTRDITPTTQNAYSLGGGAGTQFNTAYVKTYYENGYSLSSLYLGKTAKAVSAATADTASSAGVATTAGTADYATTAGELSGTKILNSVTAGTVTLYNMESIAETLTLNVNKCICTKKSDSDGYLYHFTLYCVNTDDNLVDLGDFVNHFNNVMTQNQCELAGSYCAQCLSETGYQSTVIDDAETYVMAEDSFFKMTYRLPQTISGVDYVGPFVIDIYCELEDEPDLEDTISFVLVHGNNFS